MGMYVMEMVPNGPGKPGSGVHPSADHVVFQELIDFCCYKWSLIMIPKDPRFPCEI